MKKTNLIFSLSLLLFPIAIGSFPTHAQQNTFINWEKSPTEVVTNIVELANDHQDIQNTPLNRIEWKQSQFSVGGKYKITGTLDWIRRNIQPYLQWLLFLGLTIATILLIYNGFRLVTNSAIGGGDIKTVKGNIQDILTGVVIMTGFLIFLKLVMAVLNMFFW